MIIDHNNIGYRRKWSLTKEAKYNGAYYYSIEIVKNIIPLIDTDRNWITVNVPNAGLDHSIVFIHNNYDPTVYDWLKKHKDLILVCGVPETCEKVKHLGTPIYLPLSVDTKEVASYKTKKTKEIAYAGRKAKMTPAVPKDVDFIGDVLRNEFLKELAKYEKVYAVGRVAIEAKILGCEVLPYDDRYPDPEFWEVVDNEEAAKLLQELIDEIDKPKKKKKAENEEQGNV